MADVVRLEDGALLLEVDPEWAGAIYAARDEKNVWVKEIRKQTTAERLRLSVPGTGGIAAS
jgi:hypothetical protein